MKKEEYEFELRLCEARHLVDTHNYQMKIRLIQMQIENVDKDYNERKERLLKRYKLERED